MIHQFYFLVSSNTHKKKRIDLKDICTPMFTVALRTIMRLWKQLKCPITSDWIK